MDDRVWEVDVALPAGVLGKLRLRVGFERGYGTDRGTCTILDFWHACHKNWPPLDPVQFPSIVVNVGARFTGKW